MMMMICHCAGKRRGQKINSFPASDGFLLDAWVVISKRVSADDDDGDDHVRSGRLFSGQQIYNSLFPEPKMGENISICI